MSSGSFPSSLASSPGSSITAVSRSPSPPSSRRSSKMFRFPTLHLSNGDDYVEKALPGPGPNSNRHIGLRKRRALGQTVAVFAVLGIVGLWMGGIHLPGLLKGGQRENQSVSSHSAAGIYPIPGVIIGGDGVFFGENAPPHHVVHPVPVPEASSQPPIEIWGVDLKTNRFLDGLVPWPPNPPVDETVQPLSSLGYFADNTYKLGPLNLDEYRAQLVEFARVAFPKTITQSIRSGLSRYLGTSEERRESWDSKKNVWQTDKDTRHSDSAEVGSWKGGQARDADWTWDLLTDPQADKWVSNDLAGSRIEMMWNNLPSGILRSDTLRYLLLLLEGGIYSDTDTNLLKSPSSFGQDAKLWRDGAGWLDDVSRQRISAGEDTEAVLGKPSVVVGVEADVGDRSDWFDWWPRPIQIVQWTMAMAPNHPIALSAVLRILHSTADAVEWSHDHARKVHTLADLGRYAESKALLETTVLAEPKEGGPLGVMAWTGPGVWTDAVLSYLRVKYGMLWTDLKGISQPIRVGDVVILPVTGFSPGVGNFGSQPPFHKEAMVEHKFRGSWKKD